MDKITKPCWRRRPFGRGKGQRAYLANEGREDEHGLFEEEIYDPYEYDYDYVESWQDDESTFDQVEEQEGEEGFVDASESWCIEEYDAAYMRHTWTQGGGLQI